MAMAFGYEFFYFTLEELMPLSLSISFKSILPSRKIIRRDTRCFFLRSSWTPITNLLNHFAVQVSPGFFYVSSSNSLWIFRCKCLLFTIIFRKRCTKKWIESSVHQGPSPWTIRTTFPILMPLSWSVSSSPRTNISGNAKSAQPGPGQSTTCYYQRRRDKWTFGKETLQKGDNQNI